MKHDETNSHQAHFKEAVQKRTVNGILTYRCRDVLFSPKNWDFKTKISTETWVSHFSGKAPPCSELQFPLPAHHQPGKRCLGASVRGWAKTYIASAGSTSAKRSWGPCWKFGIALGCLKLQETEFYLCFTGTKSVHDPVISWHSSTPCKIWGSNGRLDWKQWR